MWDSGSFVGFRFGYQRRKIRLLIAKCLKSNEIVSFMCFLYFFVFIGEFFFGVFLYFLNLAEDLSCCCRKALNL